VISRQASRRLGFSPSFIFANGGFGMEERGVPKVVERRALVKDPRENDRVAKRISRSCSVVKCNFNPSFREGVTFPPSQSYPSLSFVLTFKFSVDGDFHLSLAHALVEFTEITADFTGVVAFPPFDIIIERPWKMVFSFIRLSIRRSRNTDLDTLLSKKCQTDVLGCSTLEISMLDLLPCFPCDLRDPPSSKRSDQVVHKHYRLACCVCYTGGVYRTKTKRRLHAYDTKLF